MKTKTLIVGSVLVLVGVGAYFFLVKNKNAGAVLITGAPKNDKSSSGTLVSTNDPALLSGATSSNVSVTESEVLNTDKINYDKSLEIQKKYTNYPKDLCKFPVCHSAMDWECEAKPSRCWGATYLYSAMKIEGEINPLGYKLSTKSNPLSQIVKLTL